MKWFAIYMLGFMIFIGAVFAGLSRAGVIHKIGPKWTAIGLVAALGIGLMWSVSAAGSRSNININK
jgi:hypothetical protein